MKEIILDENKYKNIKKNKQNFLLQLNSNEKEYNLKEKIVLINNKNNKKMKKRIKKIYSFSTIEEIFNNLKLNKSTKEEFENKYKNEDFIKSGIIIIELKKKRHIFRKLFLLLLFIVLIFILYRTIIDLNSKRISKKIDDIKKEELVNVIVEINPAFLFKIKNETIIETICLNKDCEDLLSKIEYDKMKYTYNDTKGKKLDETIKLIYEESKKQGYDTLDGIKVLSSNASVQFLVEDLKEATFEEITFEEEIDKIKDVVDVKELELTKDDYNKKMLEGLKKDLDYGTTFSCDIVDKEVKCYMMEFANDLIGVKLNSNNVAAYLVKIEEYNNKFKRLLEKFKFNYYIEELAINEIELKNSKRHEYALERIYGLGDCNNNEVERISVPYGLVISEDSSLSIYKIISFTKIELLSHTYDKTDLVIIDQEKYCR